MKTIGILSGGHTDTVWLSTYLKDHPVDRWIGVDSGMKALHELGLIPAVVAGDFDSVDPEILDFYRHQEGIEWHVFNPVKDETDTELALSLALAENPSGILLFGATGSRLDHVLGSLHVMMKAFEAGIDCRLIDPHICAYFIPKSFRLEQKKLYGPFVSFIPWTGPVTGLTLRGFKYPLEETQVLPGSSLTVSNELVCENGLVSYRSGLLLCLEARD